MLRPIRADRRRCQRQQQAAKPVATPALEIAAKPVVKSGSVGAPKTDLISFSINLMKDFGNADGKSMFCPVISCVRCIMPAWPTPPQQWRPRPELRMKEERMILWFEQQHSLERVKRKEL